MIGVSNPYKEMSVLCITKDAEKQQVSYTLSGCLGIYMCASRLLMLQNESIDTKFTSVGLNMSLNPTYPIHDAGVGKLPTEFTS